jgi:hypothetical protein
MNDQPLPSQSAPSNSSLPKQSTLGTLWDSISKLEEHVGNDPAFGAQLAQLRKLAQTAMISTDEAVGAQPKSSLMKHAAVVKLPVPKNQTASNLVTVRDSQ